MKKIISVLGLASLAVSPAQAMTVAQHQKVMDDAGRLCPLSWEQDKPGDWISREADRRGYELEEKLMLINLCIMWAKGRASAL